MSEQLIEFLKNAPTAYHACERASDLLLSRGFTKLAENEDWQICEGGKYFVVRDDSAIIAFTVGALNDFSYKIIASHTDSPMLKLKANPLQKTSLYAVLNTEPYGGAAWLSYLDRPLLLAGRVVKRDGNVLRTETVTAPFTLCIPSVAIHQNRNVNDGVAVQKQVDLQPLLSLAENAPDTEAFYARIAGEGVIADDLFLVNAETPYRFGFHNEFVASPRIDNLTSMYASLEAILTEEEAPRSGICVAACMDSEEVGNATVRGADGDFLENTLRRIAYALRFDDAEYYKALASSFLLSADNAHAVHPNHPEYADPTNKVRLGGGIVIKHHANGAYVTGGVSTAILQTIWKKADVPYQHFFNRSDMRSGSTLGAAALRHTGMQAADVGMAQLAMHAACECFALSDYAEYVRGMVAFFAANLDFENEEVTVR